MSALAGKYLADMVGRIRRSRVPRPRRRRSRRTLFLNLSGGVLFDNIGLGINYKLVDAQSGLQIGTSTDSVPSRAFFPRLEEDIQFLSGTVSLNVTDQTNIGVSYGEVIDGRNTSKSKVFSVSMGYLFDTF